MAESIVVIDIEASTSRLAELAEFTGPKGDAGSAGLDGVPGAAGADGAQGASGADGLPGVAGEPGRDGAEGAAGRDGADGAPGAAGPQGVDGAPGIDGISGLDGAPGPQGEPGTPADTAAIDARFAALEMRVAAIEPPIVVPPPPPADPADPVADPPRPWQPTPGVATPQGKIRTVGLIDSGDGFRGNLADGLAFDAAGTTRLRWQAQHDAPAAGVRFDLDGWDRSSFGNGTKSLLTFLTTGAHRLTVTTLDDEGRVDTVRAFDFTVANAAPQAPATRHGFKEQFGYAARAPAWRLLFGSEWEPKYRGDIVCRTLADVVDPSVGGCAFFPETALAGEPSRWGENGVALDFLANNGQGEFKRGNVGMVHPKLASTLGDLHGVGKRWLWMKRRLDPRITTSKQLQDCYSVQPVPVGGWMGPVLNPGEAVKIDTSTQQTIEWQGGLDLVPGMALRIGRVDDVKNQCQATIIAYDPAARVREDGVTMGALTIKNRKLYFGAKGGVHSKTFAIVEAIQAGMLNGREPRATEGGYLELIAQPPAGEGDFPGFWLIDPNMWGREVDIFEGIDSGRLVNGVWQPKRAHQAKQGVIRVNVSDTPTGDTVNFCDEDDGGRGGLTYASSGDDLSKRFVSFGYEGIGERCRFTLDDALTRELQYGTRTKNVAWKIYDPTQPGTLAYLASLGLQPVVAANGQNVYTVPIGSPCAPLNWQINHASGPAGRGGYWYKRIEQFADGENEWRLKSLGFTPAA